MSYSSYIATCWQLCVYISCLELSPRLSSLISDNSSCSTEAQPFFSSHFGSFRSAVAVVDYSYTLCLGVPYITVCIAKILLACDSSQLHVAISTLAQNVIILCIVKCRHRNLDSAVTPHFVKSESYNYWCQSLVVLMMNE